MRKITKPKGVKMESTSPVESYVEPVPVRTEEQLFLEAELKYRPLLRKMAAQGHQAARSRSPYVTFEDFYQEFSILLYQLLKNQRYLEVYDRSAAEFGALLKVACARSKVGLLNKFAGGSTARDFVFTEFQDEMDQSLLAPNENEERYTRLVSMAMTLMETDPERAVLRELVTPSSGAAEFALERIDQTDQAKREGMRRRAYPSIIVRDIAKATGWSTSYVVAIIRDIQRLIKEKGFAKALFEDSRIPHCSSAVN